MNPPVTGEGSCRWRGLARLILIAVLSVVMVVMVGTSSATAHAELLETSPADGAVLETAPSDAELQFNENVQLIDGALQLFPGDGGDAIVLEGRTADDAVVVDLPEELPEGSYTLSYRVISADSHPVGGAISFQIGSTPTTSDATDGAEQASTPQDTENAVAGLTALQYLGLLLVGGHYMVDRLVLRLRGRLGRRTRLLLGAGFAVAAAASWLLVPLTALRAVGGPIPALLAPSLWVAAVQTPTLIGASVLSLAGAAALVLGCGGATRAHTGLALLLLALAVSSPVLVGHSQTIEPGWLMQVADVGHLLAGAVWTGGIIALVRFLAASHPDPTRPDRSSAARAAIVAVTRFSRVALLSVVVLLLSGTTMAVLIHDSWEAVLGTGYGRTLLIKLGVIAAAGGLALWNRRRLQSRIGPQPAAAAEWSGMRRVLRYEAGLLITVLAITGTLTTSSPNHDHDHGEAAIASPSPQSTPLRAESQGLTVQGELHPTTVGENTMTFRVTYEGSDLASDEEVVVRARLPDQELGPFTAEPELDPETGKYAATLTLPAAGTWEVQVSARIDTYAEPIAVIPVTVP